ncbi:ABC transporter substrate-binding protein [Glycomyces terrestris]|uniref:Carbohydrate ABC transporter substrate-binding protein n=1 Tax=Glycomyces terrestris TaxID=2493553 RepID=A0A426V3G7_9ACTN|nr:ABC transporter substrate-binding protein [Glycomyces terrestris]RRS01407.1 carbohydrate ABC transporter substrate-binding protein [Glycomyces terrestris]
MTGLDRRRLLRLAGTTGLGAGALAACASGAEGDPIASGPVTLDLWTHDPGYVTYFTSAATDPAITGDSAWKYSIATTSTSPADVVSRTINQAVAQRPLPNLTGLVIDQFPRVMRSGIAENLFVDLTDVAARFGDGLLKTQPYTVDGRVYAIESDNSISVMWYRADRFADLGIPEDVATWEDLLAIGAEIAADTGEAIGMVSNGDNGAIVNGFTQMLLQRGGSLYDASGELAVLSEESVEVLALMAEGVRTGALLSIADPYGSAAAAAIKDGRLIGTVMPNWYKVYGLEANAPDQAGLWRARTIPRFASGGHIASTLGGTAFAVLKDQAETDAALDFLERAYLTPEGQLARYGFGGYLPTLVDLYDAPEFQEITDPFLGDQRVFEVYAAAANDMPLFYQAADASLLRDSLGGPILRAVNGEIDPEAALREGLRAYERQVAE